MNKIILTMAVLCTFAAKATPSISITNEVQPVEIIASFDNTTYLTNTQVFEVGVNEMGYARVMFANISTDGIKPFCVIHYTSSSGVFGFMQEINDVVVCDHIEFSLRHANKTEGCPVTITVDTAKKEVESVVSACDFRASLETNPII